MKMYVLEVMKDGGGPEKGCKREEEDCLVTLHIREINQFAGTVTA